MKIIVNAIVAIVISLFFSPFAYSQVYISELSYRFINKESNPKNRTASFIELHNNGKKKVDLHKASITRVRDGNKKKFNFPDMELGTREYLMIIADNPESRITGHHYETMIDVNEEWKYSELNEIPGDDWYNPEYNDDAWETGCSGFGFGDRDDCTHTFGKRGVIIRKEIVLAHECYNHYVAHIDYDDAYVLYINGIEVSRANIGVKNIPLSNKDFPYLTHAAALPYEETPTTIIIPDTLMQLGNNSIALIGVNFDETSSDLSLLMTLQGLTANDQIIRTPVKKWMRLSPPLLATGFNIFEGDSIYFMMDKEKVVQRVLVSKLEQDESMCFDPNLKPSYCNNATPGAQNSESTTLRLSAPILIIESGKYKQGLTLIPPESIANATCHYTMNGSEPTSEDPIFNQNIELNKSAVIRLKYILENGYGSPTKSYTYLINEETKLPIVSLITSSKYLFDDSTGIYQKGIVNDTVFPYYSANYWKPWEYPATVQFFNTRGHFKYECSVGVSINGGGSRTKKMKSLRLSAGKEYGNNRIDYPFFGTSDTVTIRKCVLLKNGGQNFEQSYMTDELLHSIAAKTGHLLTQNYQPYILYINGKYWGIHNGRDRYSRHYFSEYFNYNDRYLDLIGGGGSIIYEGQNTDYMKLRAYMLKEDLADTTHYHYVKDRLDIENFIAYFIMNIYAKNNDWNRLNNVKIFRTQESPKWQYLLVDLDLSMGRRTNSNENYIKYIMEEDYIHFSLFKSLLRNTEFKEQFIRTFHSYLAEILSPDLVISEIQNISDLLKADMVRHQARWQGKYADWLKSVDDLINYAKERPAEISKDWEAYFKEEF